MEYVRSRDSGDGGRVADTHNISKVQVKTAAYTIKSYESEGFIFSNRGAAGSVTFTLPEAKAGELLIFLKATAGQNIVIVASGTATIRGGLTPFTGTTVTSLTASELGSIELLGDGTDWYVRSQSGTWTISG